MLKGVKMKITSPVELEALRRSIIKKRDTNKPCIAVCSGTGCLAYGCLDLIAAFREEVKKQGLEDRVDIRATGCPGFCEKGTVLTIYPQGIFYQQVRLEDVSEIISETIINDNIIDRLLYVDPNTGLHKRGAAGRGPGSARRLAEVLGQFDMTWDLYSMSASSILDILPKEFNRFTPKG